MSLTVQEGGNVPGPESGFLSNTWKLIVQGDTHAEKARDFIGKGHLESSRVREARRTALPIWLTILGFMVMGFVFWLSLTNHPDSESLLVGDALLSQDGCQ